MEAKKPFERNVNSKYGAPMGRHSDELKGKVRLARVPLDQGGYDKGGAYWGIGESLWCAWNEDGEAYFRAPSRDAACDAPAIDGCTFYRGKKMRRHIEPMVGYAADYHVDGEVFDDYYAALIAAQKKGLKTIQVMGPSGRLNAFTVEPGWRQISGPWCVMGCLGERKSKLYKFGSGTYEEAVATARAEQDIVDLVYNTRNGGMFDPGKRLTYVVEESPDWVGRPE